MQGECVRFIALCGSARHWPLLAGVPGHPGAACFFCTKGLLAAHAAATAAHAAATAAYAAGAGLGAVVGGDAAAGNAEAAAGNGHAVLAGKAMLGTDTGMIAAVDQSTAAEYAREVWGSGRSRGFLGDYRFICSGEAGGVRVIFLDCGRGLSNFRAVLLASISISLLGLLAVLLLLVLFSGRIVTPVAESYEKQRRFITDAGHEIKTPLTIIGADADLLELDWGENEWLTDIKRQTQRLTGLTNDLIELSRMDEERPQLSCIEFPLSDVTEEVVQSFQGPAKAKKKELVMEIQPLLSFTGDENAIRQLVSILMDNAVKYSPEGGRISAALEKEGRFVKLTVSNTTAQPVEKEQLNRLFDRFYRADPSRSQATGGYGLGMSIARSIVVAHRGKIQAISPGENTLSVLVSLPLPR